MREATKIIYFLTKDSCGAYKIWSKMPRPELNLDDVSFLRDGMFSDHLGKFDKFFPKLAIPEPYGMKRIEITEKDDGYFIGELK